VWSFVNQRKRRTGLTVGAAFGANRIALAAVAAGGRDAAPRLTHSAHLPLTGGNPVEPIHDWLNEHDLDGARGVGVVAPGEYQVLQTEAPPVAASELRQAASWRVRELIDFPLEQAVVDTFPPPDAVQRAQANINVVVAQRARVGERIEHLREAGLALEAIDIPELAQHNVAARLPEALGGHGLLALETGDGLITIFRDGEQFFARALATGRDTLAGDPEGSGERLTLEVQRSLDYVESTLSQQPLGALHVFPAGEAETALVERLTDNLSNVEVRAFDLDDLLTVEQPVERSGATLLHAVGAALRPPGGR